MTAATIHTLFEAARGARAGPRFWLGTHDAGFLRHTAVPLFLSARRLRGRKRLPRALGPWALDSGAFTELKHFGRWTVPPAVYAAEAVRWAQEVGPPAFAAVQDWMCEPFMLAGTGLSVAEHQRRTLASYLELRSLAPSVPWLPVLQGWRFADYLRHADDYARAGIDLAALPLVGLGSVCRRQGTGPVDEIAREFHGRGVRLHGFGLKTLGLARSGRWLASADSMAWSFVARRERVLLPGCVGHRNCANCLRWALRWREELLAALSCAGPPDDGLFGGVS